MTAVPAGGRGGRIVLALALVLGCPSVARAQADGGLAVALADQEVGAPYLAHTPLDSLRATRERPLFAPSRRPPAPPAAPEPLPPPAPAPVPVEQDPRMTLLGIVRSPGGGSAVVLDQLDNTSVSLRRGDIRRGWVVQSIEVTGVALQNQQQAATLTFPTTLVPGQGVAQLSKAGP